MKTTFSDGSFMLSWERCRAWFNADGTLKDAEYKRRHRGYPAAVAVSESHTKVRAWLASKGAAEVRSPLHARDVERARSEMRA